MKTAGHGAVARAFGELETEGHGNQHNSAGDPQRSTAEVADSPATNQRRQRNRRRPHYVVDALIRAARRRGCHGGNRSGGDRECAQLTQRPQHYGKRESAPRMGRGLHRIADDGYGEAHHQHA